MNCTCGSKLEFDSDSIVKPCTECLNDNLQEGIEIGYESGSERACEAYAEDEEEKEIEQEKINEFKQLQKFYCETFKESEVKNESG